MDTSKMQRMGRAGVVYIGGAERRGLDHSSRALERVATSVAHGLVRQAEGLPEHAVPS